MILHWSKSDDGSLAVEIMDKTKRACIFIEPNISESSWCYVEKDGDMVGDLLPQELIDELRVMLQETP